MLAIVLAAVIGCGDLCHPESLDHYAALLASAGYGRLATERAAFLIREPGGTLTLERWDHSGFQHATFRGTIPRGTIAVVHTHPRQAPEPSAGDKAEARRSGLPVVVVTPEAVVVAYPDGRTRRIIRERDWWSARRERQPPFEEPAVTLAADVLPLLDHQFAP